MDLHKMPLYMKLMLINQISEMAVIDMHGLIGTQTLTKEDICELGLRQAIVAGEGETDLRIMFDKIFDKLEDMETLMYQLQDHVKKVKI